MSNEELDDWDSSDMTLTSEDTLISIKKVKALLMSIPVEETKLHDYGTNPTSLEIESNGQDEGYNIAIREIKSWVDAKIKEME